MTTTTAYQRNYDAVVTQFNSLAPSYMAREPFPSIRRRKLAPILSEIRARGATQTPRVNTIPENDLRACDLFRLFTFLLDKNGQLNYNIDITEPKAWII